MDHIPSGDLPTGRCGYGLQKLLSNSLTFECRNPQLPRAHIQLEESETIQYLTDFYGMDDFADKWLLAAFNTKDEDLKNTEFTRGNVNFSSFGFDARSGE